MPPAGQRLVYLTIKRTLDLTGALTLGLLSLPIMLATAAAVRTFLGAPIFFRQPRVGKDNEIFSITKFRTMTAAKDADGQLLPDINRLGRFGRFLRATSLDELPQLWNVLRGDLSFVGPRPLLVQYLARYSPEQRRRHLVKPGITGWAQVNGRNRLSWDERFALDVWYVDHCSLGLDLKILVMTFFKTLSRQDINEGGSATMSEFMGSKH